MSVPGFLAALNVRKGSLWKSEGLTLQLLLCCVVQLFVFYMTAVDPYEYHNYDLRYVMSHV